MDAPAPLPLEDLLSDAAWVRALARQLVRGEDRAEELAQETWLAALRRPPARGTPLRPWLAKVARNLARGGWRSDARRTAREEVAARAEALPATDALVERAEQERQLVGLVLALEEPFRSTLLLRFYEGLEPREIAQLLGLPASTVRARAFRGLARLREELDARAPGGRSEWMSALAPLALRSRGAGALALGTAKGVLLMKAMVWTAGGLAAAVLVALLARSGGPPAEETPVVQGAEREPGGSAALGSEASGAGVAASTRVVDDTGSSSAPALEERAPGFVLRLVDEAGAPVPGCRVRLRAGGGELEELESDEDGRVAATLDPALGPFDVELLEERRPDDLIQHRREEARAAPTSVRCAPEPGELLELAIPVGPTYQLAVAWPGGSNAADFRALLWPADVTDRFDRLYAEVRDGAPPWARFSARARWMKPGPPFELRLTSRDGLWTGAARVDSVEGRQAEPVRIDFESRGCLRGSLLDRDGEPAARTFVQLWAPGASFRSQENRPLLVPTDEEGRYQISSIRPGPYTLKVERPQHQPHERELELEAGVVRELKIQLVGDGPPPEGELRGVVTSDTGRFDARLLAIASSGADPPLVESAEVVWSEEDGRTVGRFVIAGLPERAFSLGLRGDDFHAVEPAHLAVEPGPTEHAFRVRDGGERHALVLRVVDEQEREPIGFARVALTLDLGGGEALTRYRKPADGLARFGGLPALALVHGTVTAEGHRTRWLEPRRLDLVASGELVVTMRPGWARELHVVDPEEQPLEGATILADDLPLAETDADGRARLSLDARPATLRVELPGWQPHARSRIDPATGAFRDTPGALYVVLEPVH